VKIILNYLSEANVVSEVWMIWKEGIAVSQKMWQWERLLDCGNIFELERQESDSLSCRFRRNLALQTPWLFCFNFLRQVLTMQLKLTWNSLCSLEVMTSCLFNPKCWDYKHESTSQAESLLSAKSDFWPLDPLENQCVLFEANES
jgi:hypothetical protein